VSRLPDPIAGLVIRYSYLWKSESSQGRNEGVKNRPCAVVLVTEHAGRKRRVTVLPITHAPPTDPKLAVEIPYDTKKRLGLDDARSWIAVSEANRFVWPGPDLSPLMPGDMASVAYGTLPRRFTFLIRERFAELFLARRATVVSRDE
jgi:hypothetical protein